MLGFLVFLCASFGAFFSVLPGVLFARIGWWRLGPAQRDAAEPGQVLTEAAVGGFFRVLQGRLAVTTRFALWERWIVHQ